MATSKFVQRSINLLLKQLDKAIDKVEKKIKARIKDQPELKLDAELLDAEKGSAGSPPSVLILLPEIRSATRGQISLLAGLAPVANDSGEQRGKRHIRGGRKAALRRCTWRPYPPLRDPDIAAFYRRLKETEQKESKIALTAARRKLLVRLNAKLRDAHDRRRGEDLPKTA
ncbi:MAG: transposase [Lysobacterales bacterium]